MQYAKSYLDHVRDSFNNIVIYRQILNDPVCVALFQLLAEPGNISGEKKADTISFIISSLYEKTDLGDVPVVGNLWQNHLLDLIVSDHNIFTSKAAQSQFRYISAAMIEIVRSDLAYLKNIFNLDLKQLFGFLHHQDRHRATNTFLVDILTAWPGSGPETGPEPGGKTPGPIVYKQKQYLFQNSDWENQVEKLANFHYHNGAGIFCLFHALRWSGKDGFKGIAFPDPVRLDKLIGYVEERNEVLENTERLLNGLPACNMLLYGDRGTGKSSTVKALVHRYGKEGLRVVEVPKKYLNDYLNIVSFLRNKRLKFILFVDDLSFEEHEVEYKEIKAILEGGLEAAPENIVIYATSNRRHLVKEYFSDRNRESGEIRQSDTVQEKLSLADRFGITVLFPAPDQMLYLEIVSGLAEQRGIEMPPEELRRRALTWEQWQNGRSARTARQFVDSLTT